MLTLCLSSSGSLSLSLHADPVSLSQVNLVLDDGRSLGLMIRGGAEYALGIYITGVDQGSAAECGGLKVDISTPTPTTTASSTPR